jgi:hypothetical protein
MDDDAQFTFITGLQKSNIKQKEFFQVDNYVQVICFAFRDDYAFTTLLAPAIGAVATGWAPGDYQVTVRLSDYVSLYKNDDKDVQKAITTFRESFSIRGNVSNLQGAGNTYRDLSTELLPLASSDVIKAKGGQARLTSDFTFTLTIGPKGDTGAAGNIIIAFTPTIVLKDDPIKMRFSGTIEILSVKRIKKEKGDETSINFDYGTAGL